jgi:hypothetical protein
MRFSVGTEIVHKENSYPGEHKAIIEQALWDEVQRKLAVNRVIRATGANAAQPSLLAGLLYDDAGQRMTPSHANKKGVRYRYYVSQGLVRQNRQHTPRGRRVPARDLEALVEGRVLQFLTSEGDLFEALQSCLSDVEECRDLMNRACALSQHWPKIEPAQKRALLTTFVSRIDLQHETIEISISVNRLPAALCDEIDPRHQERPNEENGPIVSLSVPARIKRAGMEIRMLINGTGTGERRKPDHSLCRVLAQAHQYQGTVMGNGSESMAELAAKAGVTGSYFTRIIRLSFLAPDIVSSILRDRHPTELTARRLVNDIHLPVTWDKQRALLGVG